MQRFDRRQGFLVSAVVHLMILTILASRPPFVPRRPLPVLEEPPEPRMTVFLPPPETLRRLAPAAPPAPAPRPAPTPEPRRDASKDRISIGPPSDRRAQGPLLLRKEDDLTAVPKGRPSAAPPAPPPAVAEERGRPETRESEGLRLPPGTGRGAARPGEEGSRGRSGPEGPSIASSLRKLERRLEEGGPLGLPTGTGRQMGPLFFDPQGADFTIWINHFKNEAYRNWIIPHPALMGFRGHVDIEFTVERDGTLTDLRMLKSSGTPALDKAAQNALLGSRLLPLPRDYGPPRVTMQVTFFYNEGPQGS